jgi:uncharacterized protein
MEDPATFNSSAFHVLAKPIGPICNLNCRYCFYLEKSMLYPNKSQMSDWILQESVLEEYIRQYIQSQQISTVCFAWQGGEPTLLGIDYFSKVVVLQQKYADGKRIENTLQTNGILLNDQWCEFLARNHFLVGLSIDGPRYLHDRYRVDKGGKPSFEKVIQGIGCLKKYNVEFNTLTVVQRHNSHHPREIYRFLKEVGSGYMQFIPIVERISDSRAPNALLLVSSQSARPASISDWSVDPSQYGRFLCAIFDDWVRNDVGKVFVQLFDVALEAWIGMESSLCVFRRTCGAAAVIEHNGDIYSCDHYVYPENKLGNIMDQPLASMLRSSRQVRFGMDKSDRLPQQCRECNVLFACNGECPRHRFMRALNGEDSLNYLCPSYKLFFEHIHPYMEFMAAELRAERPPANIISWVRAHDRQAAQSTKIGRNDPCPCGSGRKFKHCCGKTQSVFFRTLP